ncbi:polymerase [Rhodococcus sp. WB1]|uniref:O-antigen ligase family protein n=1 Tax=Rhodococcus aetherivorans TaxID=191292 RepID=A0AA46PTG2_9NOCA|nr:MULTISPECIES: O-antigen ligase family protein [Rhodococcus]ANZ26211.1 polymerase [Rhodococcus sp. WB1]MBC2591181.1 O-antigen ligase family protein [Rhodococcus aetherivorans]OLL21180.1 polymerase [Rhodococcus sp. M8]QPG45034.1 O-antigen ligase family protein [Rhodococcus sp. M8]UGQ39989.1 O-antigen ligase family protein [Rhodococcus aetherivorans]
MKTTVFVARRRPGDHFDGAVRGAEQRERTPWFLAFLCLLIPCLPAFATLPGPLKSNGSPARMAAVMLFGLVVLGFLTVRRTTTHPTVNPGVVVMLLFFLLLTLVYGIGLLRTGDALVEANKTRAIITLVANVGVALYVLVRIESTRQRTIILGCLTVGLAFACSVGLLQSLTSIDLRFLFMPPGFVVNLDPEYLQFTERRGAVRVVGTSEHAIEFSVLAAVTVPMTIHFARYATRRSARWAAVATCGVALVSMPAAISRTGVLTLLACLLVYMFAFQVRQLVLAAVAGAAAIMGYAVAFPETLDALWRTITGSEQDDSILTRTADYAAVSQTFRENPVFGVGLGGAPPSAYQLLDNEWLRTIVQGGVVGLAAMILLTGGAIFGISAGLRRATSPRERDQAYMMGSVLVGILVSSTTFDLFFYQQATFVFFIVFGLLWSTFSVSVPEIDSPDRYDAERDISSPQADDSAR